MITEQTAAASASAPAIDGQPMQRLADRLIAMVPPQAAPPLAMNAAYELPKPSPAVSAAIARSQVSAAQAKRRADRGSYLATLVGGFVSACGLIPFALVSLLLRLVMARLFFLDGQSKIDGPIVAFNIHDIPFSVILPQSVRADTFAVFAAQYSGLPVSSTIAAYVVSYGEFLLPIMLVLGLGTRFAALLLLGLIAVVQIYVMPQSLWVTHVYWASILLVLTSLGAGQISLDQIIRMIRGR